MLDAAYYRALCAAELLLPGEHFSGMSVWRERGLRLVDLLTAELKDRLDDLGDPFIREHPFLMREHRYREVFPEYHNVHTVAGVNGRVVLRPDNMVAAVDLLRTTRRRGPLISVGGLLREFSGRTQPLFRERYIWPAIQITQLVDRRVATRVLDQHQRALEALFASVGLPVFSIRVPGLATYGSPCYLTIAALPDGRPTVLSTAFVMSPQYQERLGVEDGVLDIGFTGKVVALIAAHHRDHRGVLLPSKLAPVQVGVTRDPRTDDPTSELRAAGIRAESALARTAPASVRARAERRWHRLGVPVVVGFDAEADLPRMATRGPLSRRDLGAVEMPLLRKELHAHDERLHARANAKLSAVLETVDLRGSCDAAECLESRPVYGFLHPAVDETCDQCNGRGTLAMPGNRIY